MRKRQKNHWILFLGVFVLTALVASPGWSGQGLSRSEAAKIISNGGPKHVYFTLPTGKVSTGSLYPFPGEAGRLDYLRAWV